MGVSCTLGKKVSLPADTLKNGRRHGERWSWAPCLLHARRRKNVLAADAVKEKEAGRCQETLLRAKE